MKAVKLGVWFKAIRPFTLTGSIIPVTLGSVFALSETTFQLGYYLLSILTIVLLQASANLLSDVDDYSNKVDTKDSYGSSRVIVENLLKPEQILLYGRILLISGFLIGIFLSIMKGIFIFILGLLGILAVYFYTGKPLILKYRGLGAPLVFLLFGPFMVLGAYYVQLQRVTFAAFLISLTVGLLTTAILHANDIRDVYYDKRAGIKTLPIIVGEKYSHLIYYSMLSIPYIVILIMVICRILQLWSLLCFLTIPSMLKIINKLRRSNGSASTLANLDKETAELQGKFGIILILSLVLPHFIG